jgi:hypothetical protein
LLLILPALAVAQEGPAPDSPRHAVPFAARHARGPRRGRLATLIVAREIDQQFEWTMHERAGVQVGLEQEVIDVVKYDRPVDGLALRRFPIKFTQFARNATFLGVVLEKYRKLSRKSFGSLLSSRKLFFLERFAPSVELVDVHALPIVKSFTPTVAHLSSCAAVNDRYINSRVNHRKRFVGENAVQILPQVAEGLRRSSSPTRHRHETRSGKGH